MTRPVQIVGLDDQLEPVWDIERAFHLDSGAGVRDIADGAADASTAGIDAASLENSAARCDSVVVLHSRKLVRPPNGFKQPAI
jgi:hypothetical protein